MRQCYPLPIALPLTDQTFQHCQVHPQCQNKGIQEMQLDIGYQQLKINVLTECSKNYKYIVKLLL